MPLPRLLLPLCGLLLVLAVTAATAAAPPYGKGEVRVVARKDGDRTTRDGSISYCTSQGGSLVPMATDAVHTLVTAALDGAGVWSSFSYMGASTMMSSSKCTTTEASLECIWYWDQGRYIGVENVLPFYRGNRDTKDLTDAGMMTTTVSNHWRVESATQRCPCWKMERYGGIVRDMEGLPNWCDTQSGFYNYGGPLKRTRYHICAIDVTITTTTAKPPNGVANRPLVASLPVAVALAVMAVAAWL